MVKPVVEAGVSDGEGVLPSPPAGRASGADEIYLDEPYLSNRWRGVPQIL
jgi:hypothetical protein